MLTKANKALKADIHQRMTEFTKCKSRASHEKEKNKVGRKKKGSDYFPLIGDPCYSFSQKAIHRFFKDTACCVLFWLAIDHLRKEVKKGKKEDREKGL